MESTVDAQQWRLEVERVLPSLRVHVRQDNRVCIYMQTLYTAASMHMVEHSV